MFKPATAIQYERVAIGNTFVFNGLVFKAVSETEVSHKSAFGVIEFNLSACPARVALNGDIIAITLQPTVSGFLTIECELVRQ